VRGLHTRAKAEIKHQFGMPAMNRTRMLQRNDIFERHASLRADKGRSNLLDLRVMPSENRIRYSADTSATGPISKFGSSLALR
jgi:hypothetical protein